MIQSQEIPSSPEVAPKAVPPAAGPATGKDFAAHHAEAVARAKTAADKPTPHLVREHVPDGETWEVTKPGAHSARILTGPRKGQFINLTYGERRGMTFTIEHRNGKTFHVYGENGAEVLVKPAVDRSAVSDAAKRLKRHHDQPPAGERWAPVEGHATYADILGGPRNGLFVNISGGIRDGMAFQIVHRGGKVFHVYGTGTHRQYIPVAARHAHESAPTHHHTNSTTGSTRTTGTGGTAPDDSSDGPDAGSADTGGVAAPGGDAAAQTSD